MCVASSVLAEAVHNLHDTSGVLYRIDVKDKSDAMLVGEFFCLH
jgi:hypothetical protein